MDELFTQIIEIVKSFGYIGIFLMTFVEATFIPIPSEITLIPAGYLAAKGDFIIWYVLIYSITGTICGATFSYYIALKFGRALLLKYGRYFFVNEMKLKKIEQFFKKHGPISTFTGRIMPIPGVKHFISFPAGLGKMDIKKFIIYSSFGSAIWVGIIVSLGYFIGDNEYLIKKHIGKINIILFLFISAIVCFYLIRLKINKKVSKPK